MFTAAFILLCVAVICIAAPTGPYGNYIAIALAVVALILFCLSTTRTVVRADTHENRRLMSHVETRSLPMLPPLDATHTAVLRTGDARFFVVVPN